MLDNYISVVEASKKWELSEGWIRSLCIKGEIKCTKFRNAWLIEKDQPNPKQQTKSENLANTLTSKRQYKK